ncbi:tryptophan--tRNA ligase [Euzebya tangerina]|uniref:tryptophan--tRNA ligase n=1 Tax=Euzebya tangerina TaxID=591198 RepID=UPI000E313EBE|nr:tryptophan--tRNA ligase [Euzebya tangerina]
MPRVFSGIQPTGDPHLGNWIGAISRWADEQQPDHVFCIVDLHAITIPKPPGEVREKTLDLAMWLFAAGLDPEVSTVFVQSHVRQHTELAWILACTTQMGELNRMTQFKEKSDGKDGVSAGLYTYPTLMAADILLYQTDEVPVGDDQTQHIELTRDVAQRFNARHGETFVIPKATIPRAGARVMDLQRPEDKMSKSAESQSGAILLAETEKQTAKKIMRAVTDSGSEVVAGPDKPGVTNLLDLLSAVTGRDIPTLEADFEGKMYGDLKKTVAEAVNDFVRPARERYAELEKDPAEVRRMLAAGATKAGEVAEQTMADVREAVGFLQ